MSTPILLRRSHNEWVHIYAVESESKKGKYYYLGQTRDGRFGCNCPAWLYRNPERKDCKHIRALRAYLNSAARLQTQQAGQALPAAYIPPPPKQKTEKPVPARAAAPQPAPAQPVEELAPELAALRDRLEHDYDEQPSRARFIELL